jgi:hypothetical protein
MTACHWILVFADALTGKKKSWVPSLTRNITSPAGIFQFPFLSEEKRKHLDNRN